MLYKRKEDCLPHGALSDFYRSRREVYIRQNQVLRTGMRTLKQK
jgi:hypothetical protein